jgi:hypothetical protein
MKRAPDPNNWPDPISTDTPLDTPVKLRLDSGVVIETRTRSKPWQLGSGHWVVAVVGRTGGFKLQRVARLDGGK